MHPTSRIEPMNVHEQLPSQSLLPGAEIPKKTEQDAKFQNGEQGLPKSIGLMVEIRRLRLMEVVGVKSKPDYNGPRLIILAQG